MSEPVTRVSGRAYPWGAKNIDTDVIIPAHWLKTTTREGLGKGAFETVRAQPGAGHGLGEVEGLEFQVHEAPFPHAGREGLSACPAL